MQGMFCLEVGKPVPKRRNTQPKGSFDQHQTDEDERSILEGSTGLAGPEEADDGEEPADSSEIVE
jgi:hypothetical protein